LHILLSITTVNSSNDNRLTHAMVRYTLTIAARSY